ncbi:MAG: methyltransferase domain-containing protein [Reichenbachiella sp.]|uniref:O-methyltransferase n=1 Tax=Reichenbachiella sp. TaxID=2184521 RepID=UPI003267D6B5
MQDQIVKSPTKYESIKLATEAMGFTMPSDLQTGGLLRTLIASKPAGRFLELGTGTGLSLSWIVEAMDEKSEVISIDNDETVISIARDHFSVDSQVTILCQDAGQWILEHTKQRFDLIFADAWPGKYEYLDETLDLLDIGGVYFIDDMVAQPNWPEGHEEKAMELLKYLATRKDFILTQMSWSTGLVIATKVA